MPIVLILMPRPMLIENGGQTDVMAYQREYVRSRREAIIVQFFNSRCFVCKGQDSPENLQMGHVRPTGVNGRNRGSRVRLQDLLKNLDCYRPMHHDCHKQYDNLVQEEESLYE